MDQIVLGRTGLEIGVAGLGCGGHSRLGQATGATEEESVALVRRALDLGVTYIDTARAYGTEEIVGRAVEGRRHEVEAHREHEHDRHEPPAEPIEDDDREEVAGLLEGIVPHGKMPVGARNVALRDEITV